MAPICDTRTEWAHEDCVRYTSPWWEHPASLLPKNHRPSTTNKNTTVQSDYQYRGSCQSRNSRYGAQSNRDAAVGISKLCSNSLVQWQSSVCVSRCPEQNLSAKILVFLFEVCPPSWISILHSRATNATHVRNVDTKENTPVCVVLRNICFIF